MSDKRTWPQAAVDAFQDLVVFMQRKWVPSIFTILLLMVLSVFGLGIYILYQNSSNIMSMLEKTHTTPESLQTNLVNSVSENMAIDRELTALILQSKNAVSAVFFKFHNSKTDLQGKHDFFYSGTNEISRTSDLSFLPTTKDVPITRLGQYMIPFLENKCQVVTIKDISTNNWLKGKLESDNISHVASCPIYDHSGRYLLGFVELIYLTPDGPVRTDEALKECLRTAARKLSAIISSK